MKKHLRVKQPKCKHESHGVEFSPDGLKQIGGFAIITEPMAIKCNCLDCNEEFSEVAVSGLFIIDEPTFEVKREKKDKNKKFKFSVDTSNY
jgi:hypothetical protein